MRDNLANLNNCAAPFLSRAAANLWWSRCNISDLILLKQQARNGIRTEWRHTLNGDRVSPFRAFSTLYGNKGSDYINNEF